MAYDLDLADAVEASLIRLESPFEKKKMFGGLCFLVDQKMCLGIMKSFLMARVGPDYYEQALAMNEVRPMDFTRIPMKGYVYVTIEDLSQSAKIDFWVNKCLEFNPKAKSSKKKKKKN